MNRETRELLERHFDTAFDAPDGIKKLRELILTLAMQGKLVPQNPDDQPASELFKEIEAEKKRLIKEGKIKPQAHLPPIKPEEIPYEIPKSWKWVKLGNLVSIQTGKKDVNQGAENGQFPFFSCAAEPLKSNEYSFNCEALLLPGNGANVGLVTYYSGKFEAYQRTYVLNNFLKTNPFFLERSLKALFLKSIEGKQYGSAINYIKLGNLTGFLVPLPPINEQRRIVEKIDALMARVDELERLRNERDEKRRKIHKAAIDRLLSAKSDADFTEAWRFITGNFNSLYSVKENVAELRKAILQLAVMGRLVPQDPNDQPASELLKEIEAEKKRLTKEGKIKPQKPLPPIKLEEIPYEAPMNWKWIKLGEAGNLERGKSKHRPRNDKKLFKDGTYPFVQTGDVSNAKFSNFIINTCSGYYNNFGLQQSKLWPVETLCITIAANIAETGFLGIEDCIPDSVVAFYSISNYIEKYVKLFIEVAKADLEHFAPSTAQKNINLGILNDLNFPMPPLKEQQRIVEKVDQLMALCDRLEQNLAAATEKQAGLLNSLMAQV